MQAQPKADQDDKEGQHKDDDDKEQGDKDNENDHFWFMELTQVFCGPPTLNF